MKRLIAVFFPLLLGLTVWYWTPPEGISSQGWHLLAIFLATISAIVLRPAPMGMIGLCALSFSVAFGVLSFPQAFSGFSTDIVWLVVAAFFIARALETTGFGSRLSLIVMSRLGKNSLGLGYGLVITDFLLAPVVPSFTARAGGIVYPIVKSLAQIFTGSSHDPKMGGFLALCAFQGAVVTSAMFLTAMAANPLIVQLAKGQGIEITWGLWALSASVPGLCSLALIPYFLYKYISPSIRHTPHAKEMADKRLHALGPMTQGEWIVIGVFGLLLSLWIMGPAIGMSPATAALLGLSIFLVSGVLSWKDILLESGAWDTFVWFAALVSLSGYLNEFGLSDWFGSLVISHIRTENWAFGLAILSLFYFYIHYLFASSTAHIGAMFAPFLILSISMGAPPMLATLILAFFSSLFGGLTHYSSGPAPIFFGAGYVSVPTWWRIGFWVSVLNILVWTVVGAMWWKLIGIW